MHLGIVRLSAFGDVALTIPVIDSLARQYPELVISFISNYRLAPLTYNLPPNVNFVPIKTSQYKGLTGLYRLYKRLRRLGIDTLADFHDVLRTKVLRFFFGLRFLKKRTIDKGRADKKRLTRAKNKVLKQLPHTTERYAEVLAKLGFPVKLDFVSIFEHKSPQLSFLKGIVPEKNTSEQWLGIAPFAKHKGKIYPQQLMQELIEKLAKRDLKIFLFGGKEEVEILEKWAAISDKITSIAGKLTLQSELILMSQLDLMLTMDSANLHFASLVNTPAMTIWGATHPFAGFTGFKQAESLNIQRDMQCRPCSVYGNKSCKFKDYPCLQIPPVEIEQKIIEFLRNKPAITE